MLVSIKTTIHSIILYFKQVRQDNNNNNNDNNNNNNIVIIITIIIIKLLLLILMLMLLLCYSIHSNMPYFKQPLLISSKWVVIGQKQCLSFSE